MMRAIIKITFLEGLRNKAIYGISLMAGLIMAFIVVISGMIMRDVGKVATDLALSTVTFASLMVLLFIGIGILAKDLEHKTIYLALSRAVPRSRYLLARFLGLGLLQAVIVMLLLIASLATLFWVKQVYVGYFGNVSLVGVVVAHFFILVQMWLLTAISILFSMIASTSFVTFILTIITWLIGSSTQEVKRLVETVDPVRVSAITKAVAKAAYYVFPNLALFDLKSVAAHGLEIDFLHLIVCLVYGFGYGAAVLTLAIMLFRRKELT